MVGIHWDLGAGTWLHIEYDAGTIRVRKDGRLRGSDGDWRWDRNRWTVGHDQLLGTVGRYVVRDDCIHLAVGTVQQW